MSIKKLRLMFQLIQKLKEQVESEIMPFHRYLQIDFYPSLRKYVIIIKKVNYPTPPSKVQEIYYRV